MESITSLKKILLIFVTYINLANFFQIPLFFSGFRAFALAHFYVAFDCHTFFVLFFMFFVVYL